MDIAAAMDDPALFGPWFQGESWDVWRAILKAAFALPMSAAEIALFREVADRDPPVRRVRELWVVAGRRGGKDSIASLIAAYAAALFEDRNRLRPGERALVMCLACDRDQAKIALNYTRSYFVEIEMLAGMVQRETANGFELDNGVDVAVATNSYRSVRGRPILCVVADELAFWRDERSANPDSEVYAAVVPGMTTLRSSMFVGISSPHRKAGLLFEKWRDNYGKNGNILVIRAPSRKLNPTLDQAVIDRALEEDPAAAAAEWLAEFRTDIETFISRDVVDAAVVAGRYELPPVSGVRFFAFTDPSGAVADSMTLGIGHAGRDDRVVLDAVRERKPPFSPDAVVDEFATLLKNYHLTEVTGDRYAGEWPRERFRRHGINYLVSEKSKSEIYRDSLPILNSGRAELLDSPRLIAQLCSLERRTSRGGRDTIDHPVGGRDDLVNSALGAILLAADRPAPLVINPKLMTWARTPTPYSVRHHGRSSRHRFAGRGP